MGKRLIYVEDAIKALHDEIVRRRIDEYTNDDGALDEFDTEAILRRLPSAQPQRKGRWIYGEDEYGIDGYHCDKCGFFVPWDYAHKFINYIEDYNFCPNCGADMRGDEDET